MSLRHKIYVGSFFKCKVPKALESKFFEIIYDQGSDSMGMYEMCSEDPAILPDGDIEHYLVPDGKPEWLTRQTKFTDEDYGMLVSTLSPVHELGNFIVDFTPISDKLHELGIEHTACFGVIGDFI